MKTTVSRVPARSGVSGYLRASSRTTVSRKDAAAHDRVNRQFVAERLDLRQRGSSRTSVPQGFAYVRFIIDVFAACIVGWLNTLQGFRAVTWLRSGPPGDGLTRSQIK